MECYQFFHQSKKNVKGLLSIPNALETIKTDFESIGYTVAHQLIDCSLHGIPQSRKRVIIMRIKSNVGIKPNWNIIDTNPAELAQTVTMKTSNIAAQMVLREGEAMETGWDGKAGREWNKLNDSKTHLHHLLLYVNKWH
mgnify:CR=1 FL=1